MGCTTSSNSVVNQQQEQGVGSGSGDSSKGGSNTFPIVLSLKHVPNAVSTKPKAAGAAATTSAGLTAPILITKEKDQAHHHHPHIQQEEEIVLGGDSGQNTNATTTATTAFPQQYPKKLKNRTNSHSNNSSAIINVSEESSGKGAGAGIETVTTSLQQQQQQQQAQSEDESSSHSNLSSRKKSITLQKLLLYPGQLLLCRDEFKSKYTGELMHKWRKASIVMIDEIFAKVLIHYEGWSDTFDVWIDLIEELEKIAPIHILSKEECEKGILLDSQRLEYVKAFVGLVDESSWNGPSNAVEERVNSNNTSHHHLINGHTAVGPAVTNSNSRDLNDEVLPSLLKRKSSNRMSSSLHNLSTQDLSKSLSQDEVLCPVGTMLDILDIYYKAGSDQPVTKWRKAQVIQSHHTMIRIHYIGWDNKFDEDLDFLKDGHRISEFGTKSTEQTSKAVALQKSPGATSRFFPTGLPPIAITTTSTFLSRKRSDSDNRLVSSASNSSANHDPQSLGENAIKLSVSRENSSPTLRKDGIAIAGEGSGSGRGGGSGDETSTSSSNRLTLSLRNAFKFSSNTALVNTNPANSTDPTVTNGNGSNGNGSSGAVVNNSSSSIRDSVSTSVNKSRAIFKRMVQYINSAAAAAGSVSLVGVTGNGGGQESGEVNATASNTKQRGYPSGIILGGENRLTGIGAGGDGVEGNNASGKANNNSKTAEERQLEDIMAQSAELMKEEIEREKKFIEALGCHGLHVIEIEGDGNCLFRAISHQLFLNEEKHEELRQRCVEHLIYHKDRFQLFCPDDFDQHIHQMRHLSTWGDDLEIRALEEIIDRNIRIYSSDAIDPTIPIKNNFEEEESLLKNVPPLKLSYHGHNHYNSIFDERIPLPLSIRRSRILMQARMTALADAMKSHSKVVNGIAATTATAAAATTTAGGSATGGNGEVNGSGSGSSARPPPSPHSKLPATSSTSPPAYFPPMMMANSVVGNGHYASHYGVPPPSPLNTSSHLYNSYSSPTLPAAAVTTTATGGGGNGGLLPHSMYTLPHPSSSTSQLYGNLSSAVPGPLHGGSGYAGPPRYSIPAVSEASPLSRSNGLPLSRSASPLRYNNNNPQHPPYSPLQQTTYR